MIIVIVSSNYLPTIAVKGDFEVFWISLKCVLSIYCGLVNTIIQSFLVIFGFWGYFLGFTKLSFRAVGGPITSDTILSHHGWQPILVGYFFSCSFLLNHFFIKKEIFAHPKFWNYIFKIWLLPMIQLFPIIHNDYSQFQNMFPSFDYCQCFRPSTTVRRCLWSAVCTAVDSGGRRTHC